jgi:hypothetical protein
MSWIEELLALGLSTDLSGSRGGGLITLPGFLMTEVSPTSLDPLLLSLAQLPSDRRLGVSPFAFYLMSYCAIESVTESPPVVLSMKLRAAAAPSDALLQAGKTIREALVKYFALVLTEPDILGDASQDDVFMAGTPPTIAAGAVQLPPPLASAPLSPACTPGHAEFIRFLAAPDPILPSVSA